MNENYLKTELNKLIKEDSTIFDFIQYGALDGIWYWDLENLENEWMSPKFWATLGYDPKEKKHLAREWKDIIFEDDLKISLENFQKHCKDANYPYDQIVRYRHRNGATVWVRCRGIAVRDKNNKPIRMLGAHIDVTNLKQVEEKIRNLSNEYETVFNGTQDAMFLIDVDKNNHITYRRLNVSHEKTTGLTTEIVSGKSPRELFGDEMGKTLEENYMKCILSKVTVTYEEDLTLLSGQKTWLTTLSPVIQDGNVVHIVGASRDITERKKAQIEVFDEKEKLNIILQSIGDGVISIDNNNNINFINSAAARILECTSVEGIGKNIEEFLVIFKNYEPLNLKDSINDILSSETPVELFSDVILLAMNSIKKRISAKGSKIKGMDGNVQGVLITLRDETEKLKSQEKLAYLSIHDSLTGLYNRAYFDTELKKLDTKGLLPLSIIVGDANGLKLTNDVFGHADGDRLLIKIATILKQCSRYDDVVSRWGGDEFSIILPKTTKVEALQICKNIKEKCEISELVPIKPSIALGASTKLSENQNISKILAEAEELMYKNKLMEGKKVRRDILSLLQKLLQERSKVSIEHCDRMKMLASSIQYDLCLSEKEGEYLSLLAEFHDIGCITVNRSILSKSDGLDEDEWKEIKKHPETGYRIAQSSMELVHIADLILTHHEKWDGSGYPQGLRGEEIPRLSRILSLMDTYDTITHDRPYRKTMCHEDAVYEIRRCSGTQFDPNLTEIFLSSICKIK